MDLNSAADCTQIEQVTKERLATFYAFFQNAPVAMLLLDGDRQIREMNKAAEATFAASAEELKGIRFGNAVRCISALSASGGCGHGPSCGSCSVRDTVVETYETGQGQRQVQVRLELESEEDSSDKYVLISTALNDLPDGRQVLVCIEDVTEQKRAEQNLQKALLEIGKLKDRLQEENVYLREEISGNGGHEEIVGRSEILRLALGKVEHVADTDANVLLLGETGTGKELFARAIHKRSSRNERPLVKVNCAALPSSLIESELFGHVKGAFTGALADKVGRFQMADGGTLFLDEIGELDPNLQSKLLRVLQEGEFERVGGEETIKVDVRVIAATNRDVQEAMREGSFRPDLYYRLAVFPVEIPPLSLRRDDIPLLVWHFIEKKQRGLGKNITKIPSRVMEAMMEYEWPGNVRELENVVERAIILSPGPSLVLEGLFAKPAKKVRLEGSSANLEDIDRAHIMDVLEECDWRIKGMGNTAERLGLKPSTLRYRMKKLGIQRPPRRPR
ncbi:MAG: sigma 54-interacting transcriptional regulator [Pirellulales bacterium]|nr:sigma 54-interacting transcriptional regulator [Pirellulales bacterium]